MRKNPLYLACALSMAITFSGCQLLNDPLPQLWFFTYSNGGDADSLLNPASFISLHKDGTFTRDFGRFVYARWKGCFFDEEDCSRANAMIKDIFQHRTIAWAHTDNKYKFFISAFQQMKGFLL